MTAPLARLVDDQPVPRPRSLTAPLPPDVFPVSGSMPAGYWSRSAIDVTHSVRFSGTISGIVAHCSGCPEWSDFIGDGLSLAQFRELVRQHTGEDPS